MGLDFSLRLNGSKNAFCAHAPGRLPRTSGPGSARRSGAQALVASQRRACPQVRGASKCGVSRGESALHQKPNRRRGGRSPANEPLEAACAGERKTGRRFGERVYAPRVRPKPKAQEARLGPVWSVFITVAKRTPMVDDVPAVSSSGERAHNGVLTGASTSSSQTSPMLSLS